MSTYKNFEEWHEEHYSIESVKAYKHFRKQGWHARDAELAEKDKAIEERDSILRQIETILGADPDSDHSMLPEIIRGMRKTIDGSRAAIALRNGALKAANSSIWGTRYGDALYRLCMTPDEAKCYADDSDLLKQIDKALATTPADAATLARSVVKEIQG